MAHTYLSKSPKNNSNECETVPWSKDYKACLFCLLGKEAYAKTFTA